MPKSKVRKKVDAPARPQSLSPSARAVTPSPSWYPVVVAVILLVGLAYLVVFYLTSEGTNPHIPFMGDIGGWNFAVGFGIMLVGLVMLVRWR